MCLANSAPKIKTPPPAPAPPPAPVVSGLPGVTTQNAPRAATTTQPGGILSLKRDLTIPSRQRSGLQIPT